MTDLDPLRRLGESFATIAEEDARRHRRRTRLARWFGVGFVVVAGAGTAAVAADLISVGRPEPDTKPAIDRYQPRASGAVDVTAADAPLSWGVSVYPSRGGERCALVGQIRAGRLGIVRDGTFRPYVDRTAGVCGRPDAALVGGFRVANGRALVYGIARSDVREVRLVQRSGTDATRPGRRGAYLFVLTDDLRIGEFTVEGYDTAGKLLSG